LVFNSIRQKNRKKGGKSARSPKKGKGWRKRFLKELATSAESGSIKLGKNRRSSEEMAKEKN